MGISAFGLTILWSIRTDLVGQQIIFILFGFLFFFLFSQIDYRLFFHFRFPVYFLICLALLATLFLAPQTRGVTRWLEIGGFRLQPSEILKPFLILVFASFLSHSPAVGFKRLIFMAVFFLLPLFLIFKQPDLGNAIVFLLIFASLLFVGGLRWFLMVGGLVLTLVVTPLFWQVLKDYQRERITSFLNPQIDPLGSGYQRIQAMVTVGAGQIFGQGLGRGTQSHLRFLPEQHTDFIFASLSEELGFLGAALLVIIYLVLLWRILTLAKKSKDSLGVLILTGIFAMFLAQVSINIGMNIGLLPITGITLPLASYGGSSIISTLVSLGIVESIAKVKKREEALEIR